MFYALQKTINYYVVQYFNPEYGGSMLLRTDGTQLENYTVQ
jgi:hypothetical protein